MQRRIWRIILSIIVAVAVFLVGGSAIRGSASARTIPTSGLQSGDAVITDIHGKPIENGSSLDKWTSYSVEYKWSIADGIAIAAGDTAEVQLPNGAVAGQDTTVALFDSSGKQVGTFTIKAGETTGSITFNDVLSGSGTNRGGTLQFYVKGTTNNNGSGQDWGINKIGWIAEKDENGIPTKLTWNIAFNSTGENVGATVVNDTLGPNQTYIPGSVSAQTGNYLATGDFVANGTITPEVSQSGRLMTFKFDNVTSAVNMTYQTKPILNSGGSWYNQATWNGKTVGSQIAFGGNGSGNGNGGTGLVYLNKEDQTSKEKLAGAVYQLQKADGTVLAKALTTDSNGQLYYEGLPAGDYEFIEVAPPNGYAEDKTPIPFTIIEGETSPVDVYAYDVRDNSGDSGVDPEEPGGDGNVTEPGNPGEPDGDGNVTEPGKPEEPGGDGNVTEPGKPGEPGGDGNVTEPGKPGGNGEVPVTPGPTEPTGPTNPTAPINPQEPQKPGQPQEPQKPQKPQKPTTQQPGSAGGGQTAGSGTGQVVSGMGHGSAAGNGNGAVIQSAAGSSSSASGHYVGKTLPQTNERTNQVALLTGSVLLMAALLGLYDRQRRH